MPGVTDIKIYAGLALLCASMHAAYAAHPLVTDDAVTQGQGNNQIELNTDWARNASGSQHVGIFTYTYGWADDVDVYVNLLFAFSPARGVSDIAIGGMWRFFERGDGSLALAPQITLANGSEAKGLGNGELGGGLTLLGSYFSGRWALHANLGMQLHRFGYASNRETHRRVVWRASTAACYTVNPRWTMVADAGIEQNGDKALRSTGAYTIFGTIYSPNDTLDLDVGVRFGSRGADISRQVGIGLTLHF